MAFSAFPWCIIPSKLSHKYGSIKSILPINQMINATAWSFAMQKIDHQQKKKKTFRSTSISSCTNSTGWHRSKVFWTGCSESICFKGAINSEPSLHGLVGNLHELRTRDCWFDSLAWQILIPRIGDFRGFEDEWLSLRQDSFLSQSCSFSRQWLGGKAASGLERVSCGVLV